MTNPDYATLLQQIAAESNTTIRDNLIEQAYVFEEELTNEEIELFNYIESDYIESNPGIKGNIYASYVGVYFSSTGESTG